MANPPNEAGKEVTEIVPNSRYDLLGERYEGLEALCKQDRVDFAQKECGLSNIETLLRKITEEQGPNSGGSKSISNLYSNESGNQVTEPVAVESLKLFKIAFVNVSVLEGLSISKGSTSKSSNQTPFILKATISTLTSPKISFSELSGPIIEDVDEYVEQLKARKPASGS